MGKKDKPESYAPKGHYSDRLRKQHGEDSEAWNPPRAGDDDQPPVAQPLPKGVEGRSLGDPNRGRA